MNSRFFLRTVIPTTLVSGLLLISSVIAAAYVQRLQIGHSDLVARDVRSTFAAADLNIEMRDIRYDLMTYVRTGNRDDLINVPTMQKRADEFFIEAKRLARTAHEHELIEAVEPGYRDFFRHYEQIMAPDYTEDRRTELAALVESALEHEVLRPTRSYMQYTREVIEGASQDNSALAHRIRAGLLLLGGCGTFAGLVAGFGIAHGINRSIVQLQIPVRGAAGKLNEVIAPFAVSVSGGFDSLNRVLQEIEKHVGLVVERLHEREREVFRSEQLAALGRLAAGIAHELRNPLMPVKFLVQAAVESEGGLHGRDLAVIDQELTRLDESIQVFLDFARPPQPEKTCVDLRQLVAQTIDLMARRAEKQEIALRSRVPTVPAEVEADRGQLRQLLLNLFLNGLDAMPQGGVLETSICFEHDPMPKQIMEGTTVAPRSVSGWVCLRVADTGCGLPAGLKDRIFEPFISTKTTGTGLGLPICQRIAEAHGGSISAVDRPQGGAEFLLRLPRTSPDGNAALHSNAIGDPR